MGHAGPAIDVINWRQGFAVLTDGRTVPITDWIDEEGEITDDRMEAIMFVAGQDGIGWFTERVRDYVPVSLS